MGLVALIAFLLPLAAGGVALRRLLAKRREAAERKAIATADHNPPRRSARDGKNGRQKPNFISRYARPLIPGFARRNSGPRIVQSEFVLADSPEDDPTALAIEAGANTNSSVPGGALDLPLPGLMARAPVHLSPGRRIKPYWTPKNLFAVGSGGAGRASGQASVFGAAVSEFAADSRWSLFDKAFGQNGSTPVKTTAGAPRSGRAKLPTAVRQHDGEPAHAAKAHPLDRVPHGYAEAFAAAARAADVPLRYSNSFAGSGTTGENGSSRHSFSVSDRPPAAGQTTARDSTSYGGDDISVDNGRSASCDGGALYANSGVPKQLLQVFLAPRSTLPDSGSSTAPSSGRRSRFHQAATRNWGAVPVCPPITLPSGSSGGGAETAT